MTCFKYIIFFSKVNTLNCYAPKLEWEKTRKPVFRLNNFELVRCNTGLQKCFGGCNHCLAIDGPLQVKSCAGDMDMALYSLLLPLRDIHYIVSILSFVFLKHLIDILGLLKKVKRNNWIDCAKLKKQK